MSGPSISAAAVARIIRDNDVSFRAGYDDRLAWAEKKILADPDKRMAYDLGWALSDGYASGSLYDRLAADAEDEKARLLIAARAEYARAIAA